jgi:hypothetical protein
MKKQLLKLKFSLIILFTLLSCRKENELKQIIQSNPESAINIVSKNYDGSIMINCVQYGNQLKNAHVNAYFKSNNIRVDVGDLKIGSNTISNIDNYYQSQSNNIDASNLSSETIYGLFGTAVNIHYPGNENEGFSAFNESIDFPKPIKILTTFNEEFFSLKQGHNLIINWEPDGSDNIFMGYSIHSIDINDDESYSNFIEDNGNLSIPSTVLSKFKDKRFTLTLYRYSANEFEINGKNILISTQNSCNIGIFNLSE